MNIIDKITRDSKILVDSAKDTISKNITTAVLQKKLDLNERQLTEILNLIEVSSSEGYQKSLSVYQNTIKKHLVT